MKIVFRAWCTLDNKMYPVNYLDFDNPDQTVKFVGITKNGVKFTYEQARDFRLLEAAIIEGKEYFESDILFFKPLKSNDYFYAVIYKEDGVFMAKGPKIKPTPLYRIVKSDGMEYCQVVANAFEDPEMYTEVMKRDNDDKTNPTDSGIEGQRCN